MFVGIDVSKDRLDVHVRPGGETFSVSRDDEGVAALVQRWADTRPTLILVTHDVDEAVVLADRVLVMRPRPGRLFDEININLGRPRARNSPLFDDFTRRVMTALDRSLDRNVPDRDTKSTAGEAMWW